jgi:hypothetical protein
MPLGSIPTKTDGNIGRVKSDIGAAPNLDNYVPSTEYETIKTYLIDVCAEVGVHAGTAGTLNDRVDALELAGGGTLQAAYDAGNTVNVLSSTAPVELLTTEEFGEILTVESSNVDRLEPVLGVRSPAFSPHALAIFGDTGGDKLEIWADSIRGESALTIQPNSGFQLTLRGGVGSALVDGADLVLSSGAGLNATNGGDITITSGNGGFGGGVGGNVSINVGTGSGGSGSIYIGDTSAGAINSGNGTIWTHTGDLAVSADVGIGGELAVVGVLTSGSAFFAIADRSTNIDTTLSNTTDYFLRVDTSGANRNITLPNPASRRSFIIKKSTTDTNTITLVRFAAENIEGTAASFALTGSSGTGRPAWMVWSDGTNWWIA